MTKNAIKGLEKRRLAWQGELDAEKDQAQRNRMGQLPHRPD